jgi:hypothetical protein
MMLPFDMFKDTGVNETVMFTPDAPAMTLLRESFGADAEVMSPATMAGKVP